MEFGVWDVAWDELLGKEGEEAGWADGSGQWINICALTRSP